MTAPAVALNEMADVNMVATQAAKDALSSMPAPEPEASAAVETEAVETPADAPTDAPEVEAGESTDEPAPDPDEAPTALPEGYVAVPTVSEGLATEFALYDNEGEVEIPALLVEYKANGKVRKDRLDQVVKMAQMGVYNEERDKRAQLVEQQYQETLEAAKQIEAVLAEREAQMERLLNDDDFLEAVRNTYLQENSPEKRAERAEQQITNLRFEQQLQSISQEGEAFYHGEVLPSMRMITTALPTVTLEEIDHRLQMVMRAHAEVLPNGQQYVPSSRYDDIRQYIVEDLALWAQMVHAKRSQPQTGERQRIQQELDKARIEAQKAKNLVGRATKPTGQAAAPSTQKASKGSMTVDEATSEALRQALASFAP